jgi:ADP-ribose pyrophosphatase
MDFHQFVREGHGWELIGEETAFANPHLQVRLTRIRTPSRPGGCSWTVVHRKAAAVVVPVTTDGRFVLVRQERVPVRDTMWEFPAGQIDEVHAAEDAAIRETALRELREEAGYELAEAGTLQPIGHFFPSAGFTDEHSYLFVARPVVPSAGGHEPDAHEAITECRAFTREELRRMVADNEIRDANTLCTFARMCALGMF